MSVEIFKFELTIVTLFFLSSIVYRSTTLFFLGIVFLIALLYFTREADISSFKGITNKTVIAPCEGKIISIRKIDTLPTPYYELVFFLNLHNIHYQYAPYKGTILSQSRQYGKFKPAKWPIARDNYRITTVFETDIGLVILQQISGFLVREIVSFVRPGMSVETGDRMGMIKFGSRCQLYLPVDQVALKVKEGDLVKIGQTLASVCK